MGAICNIRVVESNFTSSSVIENLKLKEDTGAGDNSIYLGLSKTPEDKTAMESFLGSEIGKDVVVYVYKQDLLDYLKDAKTEFYNPAQQYREKISDLYPALLDSVNSITLDLFPIGLMTSIRSKKTGSDQMWIFKKKDDPNFNYLYQICLPKLTQLRFYRSDEESRLFLKPVFNHKLNLSSEPASFLPMSESYRKERAEELKAANQETAQQKILYGCPGAGKSFKVMMKAEGEFGENIIWYQKDADENGVYQKVYPTTNEEKKNLSNNVFRTTFHPDYDYATFVGCYKPVKDENGLDYTFVPQVFTKAYIAAYRHHGDPIYLIIEEINRGNCAQIFGDLFQLLDRDEGISKYPIEPDTELAKYLKKEGVPSERLVLPDNLHIYATMNTSDQSLFPMDSAFKRRWEMEYIPIDYEHDKAKGFEITIGTEKYSWLGFLRLVNDRILEATNSEDKQMGEFFIKSSIEEDEFTNKVMFYLWNDVCKELYNYRVSAQYFMRVNSPVANISEHFTFAQLSSNKEKRHEILKEFIIYLENKYRERHKDEQITWNTFSTIQDTQN